MDDAPSDTAVPRTVRDALVDFLSEEGFRPHSGPSEGDLTPITFKLEGVQLILFAHEDDPEYFRLAAAFDLEQGRYDAEALHRLVNDLNDRMKGVKTVLDLESASVRFLVETFLCGQPVSGALLERSLSALRSAADDFFAACRPPEQLDS
ncbi:MAG: YbjN domain-containing protein [Anaeromyxobacter sp.]